MAQLADVVESIGFGPAQLFQCLAGGGVYAADGAELLIIGAVGRQVAKEWDLEPTQKSFLVTLVFIGVFIGNNAGGIIGDSCGRRVPVLVSFLAMGLFSLLSCVASNFWILGGIRFCVGLAFGVGIPPWTALASEIVPGRWRLVMTGLSFMLFTLGEIYAGVLIWMNDPYLKKIDWRWLCAMGGAPSALFFFGALFFLYESPMYNALRGKTEAADEVLKSMARRNCRPDVNVEFQAVKKQTKAEISIGEQVGTVFSRSLGFTTLIVCYSTLVMNFNYYGGLYAFPQIFSEMDTATLPVVNLIIGALWEIPGYLLAMFSGTFMGRKPSLISAVFLNGVALFIFGYVGSMPEADRSAYWMEVLLLGSYYGNKLFNNYLYTMSYVYSTEVYPTKVRVMGSAVTIASGRIGAMMAPPIYEAMYKTYTGFTPYFYLSAVMCVINVLVLFFVPETYNKKLTLDDDAVAVPADAESLLAKEELAAEESVRSAKVAPKANGGWFCCARKAPATE